MQRPFALVLAAASAGLLLALAGWVSTSALGRRELPRYTQVPTFALTSHDGTTLTSDELKGKVWLASILFTECTEACPLLTPRLVALQRHLLKEGLLGEKAVLVTFSADPERDTPEALRDYADRYGADLATWTFLTGEPGAVRSLITDGFKLGVDKVGSELHVHPDGSPHEHYNVLHSTRVVLVDDEGQVRAYYRGLEVEPEEVARDLRQLTRDGWASWLPWARVALGVAPAGGAPV